MNTLFFGLALGLGAGILDVIPMLAQKVAPQACVSALLQWLFNGVIIVSVDIGLPGWATGMLVGAIGAVLAYLNAFGNANVIKPGEELKTALAMLVLSLIIGGITGHVSRILPR